MSVSQTKAREQLIQSALHAQIVQQGVERGLSVAAATADADAAMEATFRVSGSQRSSSISLSAHDQTPITTMSNNTPRATALPDATAAALTGPSTPLFLQRSASAQRVIVTGSTSPSVAERGPASRPSTVSASLTKLRSMTSRDLHSIVRHACRSQNASGKATTPHDRIVVAELAATLQSGKLTQDVVDRVKALSAQQHKLLTALVKEKSKERLAREFLDMLHYVVFLGLFLVVSMYGRHDDTPYKMTQSLMDQLQDKPWPARISATVKTFRDSVDCIEELHSYLLGSFYDVVYSGGSFDGDSRFPVGKTYSSRGVINGYNEIWGPIRIGQLRVQGVECSGALVNASFLRDEPRLCYPEYSDTAASREAYGWPDAIYSHDAAPGATEPAFYSRSARVYPAPAFNVYLPNRESPNCNVSTFDNCDVYSRLKTMLATKFFDRATRAVFIDMTVYNRNVRDVSLIRLYVEAFPSGGMAPRGEFQTARLYAYTTPEDFQRTGVEILIVLVVTYELFKEWRARTKGVLATLHVVNLVLFYLVAALKFVSYMSLPYPDEINDHTFHNFRLSAQYFWLAEAVTSVVCLLAWIKLFHFLSFMPKFAQLIKTVERAAAEMFGLMLIFCISLVGSAMAFNMTFGVRLYNYHTFWRSFLTLTQVIIMKVDFEDLVETNQMLGPAFFCLFVVLMLFVILNMFIVVTTDAYSSAQRDVALMDDIQLNVMSMDVVQHVLHTVVFEVPILGRRLFQPCFTVVSRWIQTRHPREQVEGKDDGGIAEIATGKPGHGAGAGHMSPSSSVNTRNGGTEPATSGGCREAAADHQVDACLASLRLVVANTPNDPVKAQLVQAHLAQWQELLRS